MYNENKTPDLISVLNSRPAAAAIVRGGPDHPHISGVVRFYRTPRGALVYAGISGLSAPIGRCESPVFGFHIHEGPACTGTAEDAFADVRSHYDPGRCEHPHHAGDLPPLFGNMGFALSVFLTDRFSVDEIIGRTVIIHSDPDDFHTQPSGNSGKKIACGEIRAVLR